MDEHSAGDEKDKSAFGIIVRAKCAVIGHIVNAQMRVDEERFRESRFNRLPELIKLIQSEEPRLPKLLVDATAD